MGILVQESWESNTFPVNGWSRWDNAPSTSSSVAQSGTYSLKCLPLESANYRFLPSGITKFYARLYVYLESLNDEEGIIICVKDVDGAVQPRLSLRTDHKLQVKNLAGSFTDVSAGALTTGQQYKIELFYDATTIAAVSAIVRLDNVVVSSRTWDTSGDTGNQTIERIIIGNDANGGDITTGVVYFDNIIIRDDDWPDSVRDMANDPSTGGWKTGVKLYPQ